jgi:hypothetical protein
VGRIDKHSFFWIARFHPTLPGDPSLTGEPQDAAPAPAPKTKVRMGASLASISPRCSPNRCMQDAWLYPSMIRARDARARSPALTASRAAPIGPPEGT